jgi:hypothetical protein
MHPLHRVLLVLAGAVALGCATTSRGPAVGGEQAQSATLAQIYFWRARPGMLDAYNRYIRDVAEPIDREAQRTGAFLTVTTYVTTDTSLPWTHMRVFLLRDSVQLRDLGTALSAAGVRLQPDSARRRQQGEYSATLRDRVGATVTEIVK